MSNSIPLKIDSVNDNIYSGFWSRLSANLLDAIIVIPFIFLLQYINFLNLYNYFITLIPNIFFLFFYNVFLPKRYGGTPGKLIVGIKIVKMDSSLIGWRESILRHSVYLILSIISICIRIMAITLVDIEIYQNLTFSNKTMYLKTLSPGIDVITTLSNIWFWGEVIILLFNKRKRALHDFMAGTVIVKSKYLENIQEKMRELENPE